MTEFVYMGIMIIKNPPNNRMNVDPALCALRDAVRAYETLLSILASDRAPRRAGYEGRWAAFKE
jgi:hypothetical protein